ncbi:hypothetical protein QWZ13_03005 [Reinekea marina]|uniref:hypothetical protein n=1 Tax=Reinekea marina TaxID=1310421 RepID=UPI0025B54E4E|nr:hypothetical protein [Reinekea marina]MDN3647879.1 hypothetical protein [Reinekea marina]
MPSTPIVPDHQKCADLRANAIRGDISKTTASEQTYQTCIAKSRTMAQKTKKIT